MNWSGLPDDVFQLARHLIKKCSSSRLNQNRPLYSISVNGWKLVLLPPVLPTGESGGGNPNLIILWVWICSDCTGLREASRYYINVVFFYYNFIDLTERTRCLQI